jgi:hypothetical protein
VSKAVRNGLAVTLTVILCSGCAFVVGTPIGGGLAGTMGVKYLTGDEMEVSYNATLEGTWVACEDALREVGIELSDSTKEKPTHWMLKGRAKGGDEIEITLDVVSDQVTKVSIR